MHKRELLEIMSNINNQFFNNEIRQISRMKDKKDFKTCQALQVIKELVMWDCNNQEL